MLDEILEYEDYNEKLKNSKKTRLLTNIFFEKNKSQITIKATGISRALTIIARYNLFNNGKDYYKLSDSEKRKLREDTTKILYDWCFDSRKGVLPEYYKNYCKQFSGNDNLSVQYLEKLWTSFENNKKKKNSWCATNIYMPLIMSTSSLNAINFPIIIAEAIHSGPLKTRYLKINKDFEKKIYIQTKTMRMKAQEEAQEEQKKEQEKEKTPKNAQLLFSYVDNNGNLSTNGKKYRDKLLKQICACLLNSNNSPDYVYISKTDLANWMSYPTFATKGANEQIEFFYEKEDKSEEENASEEENTFNAEPLYEYADKKCRINQNLIKDFDISIIDKKQLKALKEENHDGYIFFKDNGSGTNSLEELTLEELLEKLESEEPEL